jgi:hypothetical protein
MEMLMKSDETLSDVFNIETNMTKTEIITKDGEVIKPTDDRIEDDYELTRKNVHALLKQGHEALNHALEIAKQSEHPRAFEVVGNLMKQLADANQQLLDLHKQKQKLDEPVEKDKSGKQITNNNAIFVGSTTELNKLIKNMTKGD